jgi:hypothetical protein
MCPRIDAVDRSWLQDDTEVAKAGEDIGNFIAQDLGQALLGVRNRRGRCGQQQAWARGRRQTQGGSLLDWAEARRLRFCRAWGCSGDRTGIGRIRPGLVSKRLPGLQGPSFEPRAQKWEVKELRRPNWSGPFILVADQTNVDCAEVNLEEPAFLENDRPCLACNFRQGLPETVLCLPDSDALPDQPGETVPPFTAPLRHPENCKQGKGAIPESNWNKVPAIIQQFQANGASKVESEVRD